MDSVMKEFEHLKIQLEELRKSTDNFGSKVIGAGGFGKVYEGEVVHSKGRSMVAIKRLNREFGQGDPEFLKEIMMLSRYAHKNLISLLGYCDEDGEKILVYEHASNGSLDRHLSSTALSWTQRLKICLDVARGIAYLHDDKGTQQRVLHRDIKSANILLDDKWNAKLSDMGLSKIGPANQQYTALFTNVVGTPGYCDPQYMHTYTLTKESDIYSFGVVLFEILCGRLCFQYTNGQSEILVPMWKQCYEQKKLDHIIFKDLMPRLAPSSLETFSDIAFQCLHNSRERRPTGSLLVKKLEIALEFQEHPHKQLTDVVGTHLKDTHVNELSKDKGLRSGLQSSTILEPQIVDSGREDLELTLMELIEVFSKKGTKDLNLQNKLKDQIEWLPDSALPSTISGLSSLTKLDLHANKIIELPESFGDLLSLVYLNLSGNQLTTFPASLCRLIHLQELDLSSNNLSVLPESIGSLVILQKLNIETNNIEQIPHSIGHCVSLKQLIADYNKLKALPEAVGKLELLETLSVRYNNISRLPTTMWSLRKLKELDLSFNELESVPESLCFATTLVKINFSNNFADLRSLPRSIGNLENLEELDISNNQIRVIPDSFMRLSKLQVLKTEGNPLEIPPRYVLDDGARAVVLFMKLQYMRGEKVSVKRKK
ncbi:putative protein kinase RLK-Pelle-CrRLK1L-1 family [Helianthus annuus]|nr:putative protein kinase RLK-Pelle-CrRLK1L-1 family [Helianthus annuus]